MTDVRHYSQENLYITRKKERRHTTVTTTRHRYGQLTTEIRISTFEFQILITSTCYQSFVTT